MVLEPDDAAKYVVFKLDDWVTDGMDAKALEDAVVIRLKDPFAPTALFTYCNTIMSVVELMSDTMSDADQQRMIDVADYFHQQACESQKIPNKRLPD
jgi:hypothetical protein